MKKLLALLLALSLTLALAGCGSKSVAGTWRTTIYLEERAGDKRSDLARVFRGVSVELVLELREDGGFTLSTDLGDAGHELREKLRDYLSESCGPEQEAGSFDRQIDAALAQLTAPVSGDYTEAEGALTLVPSQGNAMSGAWSGDELCLTDWQWETVFHRK